MMFSKCWLFWNKFLQFLYKQNRHFDVLSFRQGMSGTPSNCTCPCRTLFLKAQISAPVLSCLKSAAVLYMYRASCVLLLLWLHEAPSAQLTLMSAVDCKVQFNLRYTKDSSFCIPRRYRERIWRSRRRLLGSLQPNTHKNVSTFQFKMQAKETSWNV